MNIGLALSGGGFRATVFHLGMLSRMAQENLLEQVTFISSVSGGSFCVGLVYAANGYKWPASRDFNKLIVAKIRDLLIQQDIRFDLTLRTLLSPHDFWQRRANRFSRVIQRAWHIEGNLADVPDAPRWEINSVCYETGKNFRFMRRRMGDYQLGYVMQPDIPLSDAIAASAAYPFFIGPFVLNAQKYKWSQYIDDNSANAYEPIAMPYQQIHLWDGGISDNLGLEALFKPGRGFRDGIDFLIVSDASNPSQPKLYRSDRALVRLIGISAGQNRALYTRNVMDLLSKDSQKGRYLLIGNTRQEILKSAGQVPDTTPTDDDCLPDHEVDLAANFETTIRKLSAAEFERLFRHGFEVADYSLYAQKNDTFKLVGYKNLNGQALD